MNHADNIKRLVNIFSFSLTSYYSGNGSNEAIRETKEKLYAAIDAQQAEIDRLKYEVDAIPAIKEERDACHTAEKENFARWRLAMSEIARLRSALEYAHDNGAWSLQTYIKKALEQTK